MSAQHVHGILLLDKPLGLSSAAAVARTKRLFAARKAGHTGSLDPLASGMLPICLGEATKFGALMLEDHVSRLENDAVDTVVLVNVLEHIEDDHGEVRTALAQA